MTSLPKTIEKAKRLVEADDLWRPRAGIYEPGWVARDINQADAWVEFNNVGLVNIARALVQLAEQAQWRDISTAPRDGTRVLLFVPPYGPSTGHYREHNWGEGASNWYAHSVLNKEAEPTHWMPLPKDPTP